MLNPTIKIPVKEDRISDAIFISNGFSKFNTGERNFHDTFTQAGIKTSPFNSEKIYQKNNRLYIFGGWEADWLGRKADYPKHIDAIDVTDLMISI